MILAGFLEQNTNAEGVFQLQREAMGNIKKVSAGFSECFVYLLLADPAVPKTTASIQGSERSLRTRQWHRYQDAVRAAMSTGMPSQHHGDYGARIRLQNDLMSRLEVKHRLHGEWMENEQRLMIDSTAVCRSVLQRPLDSDYDSEPDSWIGLLGHTESQWRPVSVPGVGKGRVPDAFTTTDDRWRAETLASNAYFDKRQDQHFVADCRRRVKQKHSNLPHSQGHVRVAGASSHVVWCALQLWDTGSDFNVASGTLLARLLGPRWRQYVQPLVGGSTARMATGQVSPALGTIVLEMDWTVAPADQQLTQHDLHGDSQNGWDVIRMPIQFMVFENFELPIILGGRSYSI